jgi:hypothetical protein
MNDFPEIDTAQQELHEQIKHLDFTNYQIAELVLEKQKSEEKIVKLLNHTIKAQRKYNVGIHAVTITTGLNYSLDKKKYLEFGDMLPSHLNPVQVKEAYYIDKKIIELCYQVGSSMDKEIMDELITTSDKKLNITITAAK